ncbi:MAG: pyridoxal-phosphate dependent enzyme, partial [Acidimicrobiales bacterium]
MDAQQRSSRFAQRLSPDEAFELLGPALTVPRSAADVVLAPPLGPGPWPTGDPAGENPFLHYRQLLWSYEVARHLGRSDDDYIRLVSELDEAVEAVDGQGFRVTPLSEEPELAAALGGFEGRLLVKDETNNVSGSHKGRHLFGLALHLEILHRTGTASSHGFRLAIASCGNAALAAAVVAKAIGQTLQVFVPPSAAPSVIERLHELEAEVVVSERRQGEIGDPTYRRFLEAVEQGAVPFGCQGPDNGLTLDGGR